MQHTANEVIETIKALPDNEKDKVYKWVDKEKSNRSEKLKQDLELFKKAEKWLAENRDKYLGQWVCLHGDQLIAHGMDGMEVHRNAKEAGIESSYLVRVIEEPEAFSGAWS